MHREVQLPPSTLSPLSQLRRFCLVTEAETRPPLSQSCLSVHPHVSEDTVTAPADPR